jgi:hypothetical protein
LDHLGSTRQLRRSLAGLLGPGHDREEDRGCCSQAGCDASPNPFLATAGHNPKLRKLPLGRSPLDALGGCRCKIGLDFRFDPSEERVGIELGRPLSGRALHCLSHPLQLA